MSVLPPLTKPRKNKNTAQNRVGPSLTGLYSAALQDHFARALNLGPPSLSSVTFGHGRTTRRKFHRIATARTNDTEREVVLTAPSKPLTLAQKLKLVPCPKPNLSTCEWETVKQRYMDRCTSEADVFECPICAEPLYQNQVLLSCTHSFHRKCLHSYERHVGKRLCPLCREDKYEMRTVFVGKKRWMDAAATRIQKTYRMYRLRKRYLQQYISRPPSHPILLTKWHLDKLVQYTARVSSRIQDDTTAVETFLRDAEGTIGAARSVFHTEVPAAAKPNSQGRQEEDTDAEVDWKTLLAKVDARIWDDCPICIMPLKRRPSGRKRTERKPKKVTLLSCSHLIHSHCLNTLERFDNTLFHHVCPVCRAEYRRIDVDPQA
ncbi:hypothetical protein BC832DRAFT_565523 [Gaertneriomyces semiglobifer]|nr:hypothetical protein BC832DRAFT_565523 [Gaertneriomyces semiglobifer]